MKICMHTSACPSQSTAWVFNSASTSCLLIDLFIYFNETNHVSIDNCKVLKMKIYLLWSLARHVCLCTLLSWFFVGNVWNHNINKFPTHGNKITNESYLYFWLIMFFIYLFMNILAHHVEQIGCLPYYLFMVSLYLASSWLIHLWSVPFHTSFQKGTTHGCFLVMFYYVSSLVFMSHDLTF